MPSRMPVVATQIQISCSIHLFFVVRETLAGLGSRLFRKEFRWPNFLTLLTRKTKRGKDTTLGLTCHIQTEYD